MVDPETYPGQRDYADAGNVHLEHVIHGAALELDCNRQTGEGTLTVPTVSVILILVIIITIMTIIILIITQ